MVGATYAPAVVQTAVAFDGTNDFYIASSITPSSTTGKFLTVACTFYWDSSGGNLQHLVNMRYGTTDDTAGLSWRMWINGGRIQNTFMGGAGSYYSSVYETAENSLTSGSFNQVVFYSDFNNSANNRIFINGVSKAVTTDGWNSSFAVGWGKTNSKIKIGEREDTLGGDGSDNDFKGRISQLYIHNASGTPDIAKFYNTTSSLPLDLGTNGTSTGLAQPLIYHYGSTSTFPTNNGTGFNSYTLTATGDIAGAEGPTYGLTPVGQASVSSVINYAYQDYSQSSMAYVGPDSSNRPVFLFAYANASSFLKAVLFRINDDGTITEGSEQSPGSNLSCTRTVKCTSEYEGANSFGNNTPTNYAYLTYAPTSGQYKVQAVLADPSALTCTFGTALNNGYTPDAEQPAVAYVGNSRCVSGGRHGGGFSVQRFSRSGTTLTSEGTGSADFGSRIDADLEGFDWDGSSRYRMGQVATQNGASGTTVAAVQLGSTNYVVSNSTITGTGFNMSCNLNNTAKMLGLSNAGGTNSLRAVSITWNSAANPTLTIGTANTGFNDQNNSACIVPGHVADEAYILYNGTSTTIDYRKVTVSGTTVTIGSKVNMISSLSSFYYQMSGSSATVGTKKYLAGVQVRSSGAPYIFGYRLV